MKRLKTLTVLAAALWLACGPASAEEPAADAALSNA